MTLQKTDQTGLFIISGVGRVQSTFVVATSEESASDVFYEFIIAHAPTHDTATIKIREASAQWLLNRPQLATAVKEARDRSEAGVARWLGHRLGWEVRPAESMPVGCLSALAPDIKYYQFETESGLSLMVFAFDADEAVRVFEIWHKTQFGGFCGDFNLEHVSPWRLLGDHFTLREDMVIGLIGIGALSDDGIWRIVSENSAPA